MLRNIITVATLLASAVAGTVAAQDYPTRPVSLVVPFAASLPLKQAVSTLAAISAKNRSTPTVNKLPLSLRTMSLSGTAQTPATSTESVKV